MFLLSLLAIFVQTLCQFASQSSLRNLRAYSMVSAGTNSDGGSRRLRDTEETKSEWYYSNHHTVSHKVSSAVRGEKPSSCFARAESMYQ